MAPVTRHLNYYKNRKLEAFMFTGRKTYFKRAPKRKPFRVIETKEAPVASPPVANGSGTDLENVSMSLESVAALHSSILNAPYSSSSSSESDYLSTVKKAPAQRQVNGSASDASKYFIPVSSASDEQAASKSPSKNDEVVGNNVTTAMDTTREPDEESESGISDVEEAMPEPMHPEHELKLISVDSKTSLVVVDPRFFASYAAQVTLISGCVTLQLVHGNLQLNGYEMRVGDPINACTGGSKDFVLIEGSEFDSTEQQLRSSIQKTLDPKLSPEVIKEMTAFNNFPKLTILLFTKWENSRLSLVQAHLSARLPDLTRDKNKSFFNLTFSKNSSCIGKDWMPLIDHRLLSNIKNDTILMITGHPESGKSVLLKRIINVLMSKEGNYGIKDKVIYLDLDPGQTEFSPPAQITAVQINLKDDPLISRSYAHSILFHDRVISSVSVGSIDLSKCASVYVRAVIHLVTKIRELLKDSPCPIFVNTSGFIKGLGRSLLIDAIRIIQPTHMIEIKETLDNCNDFRFDVVFGPRAHGFLTDLNSYKSAKPYFYIDLKAIGKQNKSKGVNAKNRESQILSALSQRPDFLLTPLSKLERTAVDLKNVIHFTSPVGLSIPAVVEKLHHTFVQLAEVVNDETSGQRSTRGLCMTKDLNNNTVVGYGILFVARSEEGDVRLEVATCNESMDTVNCIIVPGGVSLPSSLCC